MKTVYLYDDKTGEFTTSYNAQESPLEPGVYIEPELSTDIEPPTFTDLQDCKFIGTTWVVSDKPVAPIEPVIPLTVLQKRAQLQPLSAWQVRKVLTQFNLRNQVETAIANADQNTKDAWAYAKEFQRDDVLLNSMATALGLTDAQLDQMFEIGITL